MISHGSYLMAVLCKLIRVVIATGGLALAWCTSFLSFYSYLYSSGAYPAKLEQLLYISWGCGEPLVSFVNFTLELPKKLLQ